MPTPIRNLEQYELIIAIVVLKASAGEITPEMIQDVRLDENYCGLTADTLTRVPTQELYDQFQSFYERIQKENEDTQYANSEKFRKWFDSLEETLQGEVATALAGRILSLENMLLDNHIYTEVMADADTTLTDEEGTNIFADWKYQVQ